MSIIVMFGCVIIVTILLNLMYKMKHRRFYQLLEQFPSMPTYPLIGNIHLLFSSYDDLLIKFQKIDARFDRLVFWIGPVPLIILKKYDDVMTVLNHSQERETYHLGDEVIGIGIITAYYKEWKQSRKMLNPAFTSSMLSKYAEVFNKAASNFVGNIKSAADTGEEIDITDYVLNANLDAIIENAMGVPMEINEKVRDEIFNAAIEGIKIGVHRLLSPWLHPDYIYKLYLKITGKHESIKRLQNFAGQILKNRLNSIQNQNIQLDNVDSPRTVIDLVLKNSIKEPDFTEIRIRNELLQIILAGMETTSQNVSFLMVMLAIHQDVQQKVYEEIVQLTRGNATITAEQSLYQLNYLEQCIQETMRMYSPVTITTRRTHKECVLKGNLVIPTNTFVFTMLHFTNRDPESFKNPDIWDPEHFSEKAIAERPKGSTQLSFGFGPRSCIGAKYAMMSVKTQISHILLNYHLSTNIKEFTSDDLTFDLMIRSKIGYPVKFTSRQKIEL